MRIMGKAIRMPRFNSSAVKRAEYNHGTRELTIWFPEGQPYSFCNVPEAIFQGLCNARSKGQFYNDHIRDRYPC